MRHFIALLRFYLLLVALFVLAKPFFVLAQSEEVRKGVSFSDVIHSLWHGIPLDLATAGYITAIVWVILGISLWKKISILRPLYLAYVAIVVLVLSLVWVSDACLYGFWGIKLDGTVWNYLDSPQGIFSSVSAGYMLKVVLLIVLISYFLFVLFKAIYPQKLLPVKKRIVWSVIWMVLGGLIFLGIRGGVGRSTANVGMVYFSERQFLNHTAVNPVFSIASSLFKTKDFSNQYDFFTEDERDRRSLMLHYNTKSINSDTLLTTSRPNVLLILMEGCGAQFVHAIDSLSNAEITPNLNRLANKGVVFTECYANSFRTDRGTLSTLSGWPAYPDVSVMKLPSLCQRMPSIAASLKKVGYYTGFLYGGDINFTNTKGYLLATGYEDTWGDTSFPLEVRRTHAWGVTDRIAFDSLFHKVVKMPQGHPWHLGFLTLASHEPWEVPYSRMKGDKIANSMAYLDDCLGNFINRLKKEKVWNDLLIILVPDHGINYPEGISDTNPRRSHIPLIWTGGAICKAQKIDVLCNQSDLAATLLGQLRLAHDDFPFSRDVLSDTYTYPSAVHVWSEGILWKDNSGYTSLNLLAKPVGIFSENPKPSRQRENAAKVYLQTIYDALH